MARSLKDEEITSRPAPLSVAADLVCALNDVFGVDEPPLFADTTGSLLDLFDFSIGGLNGGGTEATAPTSEHPNANLEYARSRDAVMTRESRQSEPYILPRLQTQQPMPTLAQRTKPRARAARSDKKQPRVRSRVGILKLRGEVTELQARLWLLQCAGAGKPRSAEASVSTAAAAAPQVDTRSHTFEVLSRASVTLSQAAVELQKLQDAQALNCSLKAAIADKVQVSRTFEEWLETQTAFQAHNFELLTGFPMASTDSQSHNCNWLYHPSDSLRGELETLLRGTGHNFNEIDPAVATYTPVFEQKSSTPVRGDFKFLGEYLWEQLTARGTSDPAKGNTKCVLFVRNIKQQDPESSSTHEKRYTMTVETPFGSVKMDFVSLIRRFVEEKPRRVVLTYTSETSVAERDYSFKESGWIVLTPDATAAADPASPSAMLQMFYQLNRHKQDSAELVTSSPEVTQHETLKSADHEYRQQELVLNALIDRAHGRLLHIERSVRVDPFSVDSGFSISTIVH